MSRFTSEWQTGFKNYIQSIFGGTSEEKKLLHVHVLDAVACLIELKKRFELTWH